MMFLLVQNVILHGLPMRWAYAEQPVTVLPMKCAEVFAERFDKPFRLEPRLPLFRREHNVRGQNVQRLWHSTVTMPEVGMRLQREMIWAGTWSEGVALG